MLVLIPPCSAQALLFNLRPCSTRRTSVVASFICAMRISIVSATSVVASLKFCAMRISVVPVSRHYVMLDTLPEAAHGKNKWDFRFDAKP